ncbi:MAG: aminopeptidase P family N-terminal domain-containing protein, partial [Pseudomonadota bacterium]
MADKQTNVAASPEGAGPSHADIAERLAALRAWMKSEGLDGVIVPRADPHRVESLPANAERLAWLTGFTGSAGMVSVLVESAALFVDGRYTLQARDQVDSSLFEVRHVTEEPWTAWVEEQLPQGGRIGFDPWLHTA